MRRRSRTPYIYKLSTILSNMKFRNMIHNTSKKNNEWLSKAGKEGTGS
jgi:hypothetical protein